MYVIHIKKLNGEKIMEYANNMEEASAKADAYSGQFVELKIMPIRMKDVRQGKETLNNGKSL